MIDYFEDLNGQARDPHFLLEDQESVEKAIELTKEILRAAPRPTRLDDAHSALVIWEHVYLYILDSNLGDWIGEIIDFLEEVGSKKKLSSEEARQGMKVLGALAQAAKDRNGVRNRVEDNEIMEGGFEDGE